MIRKNRYTSRSILANYMHALRDCFQLNVYTNTYIMYTQTLTSANFSTDTTPPESLV